MFLKNREYLLILVIWLLLITISGLAAANSEISGEGFITEIDRYNSRLKIGDKWYQLSEETVIYRNGGESTLAACGPISTNDYQWCSYIADSSWQIKKIIAEYTVVEGLVEEVNLRENYILINIFKQSGKDAGLEKYVLEERFIAPEIMDKISRGMHLVLVTGQQKILKLYLD